MSPLELYWSRCEGRIVFGFNDCCMVVGDVILAAGGPDLMAPYRGRYKTAIGFARAFKRQGFDTLQDACLAQLEDYGEAVDAPRDFDVAIVSYQGRTGPAVSPAFYHGGFWCLRSEDGMFVSQGSPETIWRLLDA